MLGGEERRRLSRWRDSVDRVSMFQEALVSGSQVKPSYLKWRIQVGDRQARVCGKSHLENP